MNKNSYIIAEIGFNHEGNLKLAEEMINAAAKAGADAVKFQTYRARDIALPSSPHYEAIKEGELDFKRHERLASVARECGVDFLSTPFSLWAVDILEKLGVCAYKVASMDCTNKFLLKEIAKTKKPVYLSTGMASLPEIAETLNFMSEIKSGPVTLLHCLSLYPAEAEKLNLAIIPYLKKLFGKPVGYSDHYPGTKACLTAAILGAEVLETHFTLDTKKEGADHAHSADPETLRQLVSDTRLIKQMLGNEKAVFKRPDRRFVSQYRRGVYTAKDLKKGARIKKEDLLFCRPTSQLTPDDIEWLNGKVVTKDIAAYQEIEKDKLGSW